ncbi:DUF1471 domain-containing protein [Enterobacter soli]|uniref:DUF1471 domain-containing protein n=1 Tax=Enterobacter soli TaxID=885040 RepID=UPI003EDA1CD8
MKKLILIATLATTFFATTAYAETVSAYGTTLDSAENAIAIKAKERGASSYKILASRSGDCFYMTAKLLK